jgi:hypothetical protein
MPLPHDLTVRGGGRLKASQHRCRNVFENGAIWIDLADQAQPLKPGHEKASECVDIGAGRQLPARLGPGERVPEGRFRGFEPPADTCPGGAIVARQLSSAISEKAATPTGTRFDLVDKLPSQSRKGIANR